MIMIKKTSLVFIILLSVSFVSSLEISPFDFPEKFNYSDIVINETSNNSLLFNGYSVASLWTHYTGLGNTQWYSILNPFGFYNSTNFDTNQWWKPNNVSEYRNFYTTGEVDTTNISISDNSEFNYDKKEHLYDYNKMSADNKIGYKIYYKQSSTLAPMTNSSTAWGGTEFTSYDNAWALDNKYLQSNNAFGGNTYLGQLFELQTADINLNSDYINLTWVGRQTGYTYAVYMWNFTSSTYYKVSPTLSSTTFTSYSYLINDAENFVNGSGKAYVLIASLTKGGVGAWFTIQTDYLSVNITTTSGTINFNNGEFDNEISLRTNSPNALNIKSEDGETLFNYDANKKSLTIAGLESTGDIIGVEDMWVKGKLGIGSNGNPDYLIEVDETNYNKTTDAGDIIGGLFRLGIKPTDWSGTKHVGFVFNVNHYNTGNYSLGSTVSTVQISNVGEFGYPNSGNTNVSTIALEVIGRDDLGFLSSGNLLGKDGIGIKIKAYQTLASGNIANFTGNLYGLKIDNSDDAGLYANRLIQAFIEKPFVTNVVNGNYQLVLNGTDEGTGIWFGGFNGQRLFMNNTDLTYSGGFTGNCVNTSYIGGFAVGCND